MRGILASVLCLIACSAGAACERRPAEAPGVPEHIVTPVAAQAAEVSQIRPVLHAGALITPAPDGEFIALAPEPARIIEITRAEGETIAGGDLLVKLEIPSAAGGVARQRAEVARARADLENARVGQTRVHDLAGRGLIARRDTEDADRLVSDATSALTAAEAREAAAQTAAARAEIRAPFAGIIVQRLHNPGDVVSGAATDPILRLVDPARLEVRAQVPARDLARVLPGATARLVGGGDAGLATLTVVSRPGPATADADGTVAVRFALGGPVLLAVDTPVQVDIDLEARVDVVTVAPEAIVRDGSVAAVFVAVGNRAERREVTLGVGDDRRVEITSGVRGGELVITRGQVGLADGAAISVDTSGR